MKRNTLTRNLKEMLERIRRAFLPATILKVFVHGSYLRGDELPGDLDVVIFANVKNEWAQWDKSFWSLRECHALVVKCYDGGMSLENAMRGPLAPEIEKRAIPMEWVTTISWSELFGRNAPYLSYMLSWEKITRRLLTKGTKGIHIQLETSSEIFTPVSGRLYKHHEIPVFLIWSNESPQSYELEPTKDEYEAYLKLEHKNLQTGIADARFLITSSHLLIKKSLAVIPQEKLGDVALQVLWNTPKYEVTEELLRESLRKFSIPEDKVYSIKIRGTKIEYVLARTEEKETKLKIRVNTLDKTNKAELVIQKILKKVVSKNEATKVNCRVLDMDKGQAILQVTKPAIMNKNDFRAIWKRRGFNIQDVFEQMYGQKEVVLPLGSNKDKLKEEINRALGMNE